MSNTKKAPKPSLEELQASMQALIEQGKKEGIVKALEQAEQDDIIVIFGSLYQVGEVHEAFEA